MDIAIPIYDRFTALDAIGPYEVLSRLPDARVTFIAAEPGPYKTGNGMLSIVAEARLDDLPHPDVIMVPGGTGSRPVTPVGRKPMRPMPHASCEPGLP